MDLLLSELRGLSERMAEVSKLFSHILCPPDHVDESSIENYAHTLAAAYPKNLQREDLQEELRIFYKIKKIATYVLMDTKPRHLHFSMLTSKRGWKMCFHKCAFVYAYKQCCR
jgi:hypothetical protein